MNKNSLLLIGYSLLVIIPLLIIDYSSLLGGRNDQFIFAQSTLKGLRLKKTEGERIKWEIYANVARLKKNLKELEGVTFQFYPKNKDPFLIKADKGWVRGNEKEEIYLKEKVIIEREKWRIKGEKMEFGADGDVITIKKNVTMEIKE